MWPWRDWVIRAFNSNMPYDQFAVKQLAGDLLPKATIDHKIATGFNRNHMIDMEKGAVPLEYQTEYVVDRVNTTGTTFLGITVGCGYGSETRARRTCGAAVAGSAGIGGVPAEQNFRIASDQRRGEQVQPEARPGGSGGLDYRRQHDPEPG
jgi:hypothetical protein